MEDQITSDMLDFDENIDDPLSAPARSPPKKKQEPKKRKNKASEKEMQKKFNNLFGKPLESESIAKKKQEKKSSESNNKKIKPRRKKSQKDYLTKAKKTLALSSHMLGHNEIVDSEPLDQGSIEARFCYRGMEIRGDIKLGTYMVRKFIKFSKAIIFCRIKEKRQKISWSFFPGSLDNDKSYR